MKKQLFIFVSSLLTIIVAACAAQQNSSDTDAQNQIISGSGNQVEILRDTWEIPHIFSDSDEGAMYGLGYVTAQDRAFQMFYNLRIIQGRLAEVIGDISKTNRQDMTIQNDRKMRTFGFYRAAQEVAKNLDSQTHKLLDAYCAGVNDYIKNNSERLRKYLI